MTRQDFGRGAMVPDDLTIPPVPVGRGDREALLRLYGEMGDAQKAELLRTARRLTKVGAG